MRSLDPQVIRALGALARLLGREVEIVEGDADRDDVVVATGPHRHRIAVRTLDASPFTAAERAFVRELLEIIERELSTRLECQALDLRVRMLERENVDLAMKNRALAEASSRDALTGLYTRWYLLEKVDEEISRSWRHGAPMSLLMMDIDHFKKVNDQFGHPTGDQILQMVSNVLRDSCRIYDIPGRYGGEEFCLMLPETRIDNTLTVAERIRRRVEASSLQIGGSTVRVTTSIGVAGLESLPDEAVFGANSLIERADRALYTAKDRGRNRVEVWNAGLGRSASTGVGQ